MFWILLSSFLLIVSVVFTVLFKLSENKCWVHEFIIELVVSWGVCFVILIVTTVMLPVEYLYDKQFIETFKRQKYYIEEIVPTLPETDNYAITQSKIELNQQLYELQYSVEHYSFFYFYPNGIMELEYIK